MTNKVGSLIGMLIAGHTFILSACSPSGTDPAKDYASRIYTVLEVSPRSSSIQARPTYPRPRDLKVASSTGSLSVKEFLSLRECELHQVLAERNSLMGKVAVASQRLFSDLEILRVGPSCLRKLSESDQAALANKLATFLDAKRAALPASLWQAILGAQENAKFWQARAESADYPKIVNNDTALSIQALLEFAKGVIDGNYRYSKAQITALENHLGLLRYGDGGQLLREYAKLVNSLDHSSYAIDQRLKTPLCLTGKATEQAAYFQNVVNKVFVGKVQAHAVLLERRYQQLAPSYLELEAVLSDVAPAAYRTWVDKRQTLLQLGRQATAKHALLIQKLFMQCGLTPGTSPS